MMNNFNVKLFVDCADLKAIDEMSARPDVSGTTSNPSLAKKAGVTDYLTFCREAARVGHGKPVSVEVIGDDPATMLREGKLLANLAPNVYVKIPITDTRGASTHAVYQELSHSGVRVNVTAVFTAAQVWTAAQALKGGAPSIISVFAGRIADAGQDPVPHMTAAVGMCRDIDQSIEVLWASSREVLNVIQAAHAGVHIITLTPDILKKTAGFGRSLLEVSLDTVKMFHNDATSSGFKL